MRTCPGVFRVSVVDPVGNGLADVRRRLELKYPDKHTLTVRTDQDVHRVDLILDPS